MTRYACDTSFAVASLDPTHVAHQVCSSIARDHRPALAGHAAFETHSVLTRLPGAQRVDPQVASTLIATAYPDRCWLGPEQQADLLVDLGERDISGGQVYDALVARAASVNSMVLLSRDARAARTYEVLGAAFELVG